MATFFFNASAANGGTGAVGSPFNQAALNAAIAAGTFRVGGADSIAFAGAGGDILQLTAAQATSTPISNVGAAKILQIAETVLDGFTDLDLTSVSTPAGSIALQNSLGGTNFSVNSNATMRLNALQADGLTINGFGTVVVSNLQADVAADLSNIAVGNFTASAALTAGVTFTGNLGSADLTITAATPQTFIVNTANLVNLTNSGSAGSITVGDGATLATTADQVQMLSGRTITTAGTGQITLTTLEATGGDADLSGVTGNVVATVNANDTLTRGLDLGTIQPTIGSGAQLTLADNAANDFNSTQFNGAGSISYARTAGYAATAPADVMQVFTTGSSTYSNTQSPATGGHTFLSGSGRENITFAGSNDTIRSGSGADTIVTGNGNNVVYAGAGADNITLGNANDFVEGGGGNDTVNGGGGNDYITDSTGNENITTTGGSDTILPGAGADTVASGGGADSIAAGSGADSITAGAANDTIIGGGGADTINMGAGSDTASGGAGNDVFEITVTGDQVDGDTIDGGDGTNSISIVQAGAAIASVFDMDDISNVLSISTANNGTAAAGGTNDITATFAAIAETTAQTVAVSAASITQNDVDLVVTNNAASSTTTFNITGGAGADTLAGSNGADTISGGAGANIITGGLGADTLTGGAVVDTFQITGVSDQVAGDSIDGGTGADVVSFNSGGGAIVAEIDMDNISNVLTFSNGTAGGNRNVTFSPIAETTAQVVVADFITTTSSASVVLTNNAASSTTIFNISGGDAADTLNGSTGNDTLRGGRAADNLVGGDGDDVFVAAFDATAVEQTATDTISGGAGTNRFDLQTGTGAVVATVDLDLVDGVTNFQTTGVGLGGANNTFAFAGVTETTAQVITVNGSSVTNATADLVITQGGAPATTRFSIVGGGGVDTLLGSAGADTLTGGALVDNLTGGAGSDTFQITSGAAVNADLIVDFVDGVGGDVVTLPAATFAGITAGQTNTFVAAGGAGANTAATIVMDTAVNLNGVNQANIRLAYDTTANTLVYDANGNFTENNEVVIASFTAALVLGQMDASNVVIV